jgi:hypothetical protein
MLFSLNRSTIGKFLAIGCLLGTSSVWAQYSKPKLSTEDADKGFTYSKSEVRSAGLVNTIDLMNVNSSFNPVLKHIGIYHNEENVPTAEFKKIDGPSPNYIEDKPLTALGKDASDPITFTSFQGYNDNSYTPPDNSIAIAPNGYIVSAMNSNYRIFKSDGAGKVIKYSSFHDLLKTYLPSLKGVAFDPRVIYDPQAGRFIMVVLYGNVSDSSKILILFSKTSDPTEGWNFYYLSGNPYNSGEWTDYPNIGVSNDELFITGNLFNNNQNPTRPIIWQIDKNQGFSGAQTIRFKTWTDLKNTTGGSAFTVVPAPFGQDGDIGPGMFFVSNDLYGGNSVRLFDLTGNIDDQTAAITSFTVAYPSKYNYYSPQYSPMKGSSRYLNAGDARIKQAFILGNTIHYVFASQNASTQNSDVVYVRLNVQNRTMDFRSLGLKGFQYSYPSIAASGDTLTNPSVMIGYLKGGSTIYPEIDAVSCDADFNFSASVVIKSGLSAIGIQNDNVQRWGDYTGCAREYDRSGKCVFAGAYGSAGGWNTLISEMTPTSNSAVAESAIEENKTVVFPNPVQDIYNVQFNMRREGMVTINLFDMEGKLVDVLYSDRAEEGPKLLSFNKAGLKQGVYLLQIRTDKRDILTKRIVVE